MKRFFSFLLFVLLLSILVGALQFWKARREGVPMRGPLSRFFQEDTERHRPEKYTLSEGTSINLKDVDVLAAMSRQRILLARAVVPSVVSITTSKTVRRPRQQDDPFFQFFHRGMDMPTQQELGSGVIVSKEGHIVTNNHVIEGMDEIQVELSDGRPKRARLIGTDAATDIAVLKIDADDLRPIPFGDSELVEVGETVMAVGNPYGLEESVTQGIISAKGRANETLSDLFQTDAAINPGNSGGPLINVRGELIGINEAIYSRSGGWQGVGFAIPSTTVRRTMDSILKTGRVVHGYLGVNLQPLTPDAAKEFGLPDGNGALVADVLPDSPAARANIRRGDFIRKFNNKPVSDIQGLRRAVAEVDVDASAPVELLREGKTLTIQATIAEKPPEAQLSQMAPLERRFRPFRNQPIPGDGGGEDDDAALPAGNLLAGVQALDLSAANARKLGMPPDVQGVIVRNVFSDSPAAPVLQTGDVIEKINRQAVNSLADYNQLAVGLTAGEPVLLAIMRSGVRMMVVVKAER